MTDRPALQLREVHFNYHERPVLNGVSFSIASGERVGLIGPNGAGKSTLLLHLNGLLHARSGQVRVGSDLVTPSSERRVRAKVGLVFSDPEDQLFMPTLLEDVAYGPLNLGLSAEQAMRRAEGALQRVGLAGFAERTPHHLSDGERRRAAIATVLAMEPEIWVLDEPATNLDPRARRDLIGLLNDLPGTILLASHDLDLVLSVCTRCLLLDGGRVVADGSAETLLSDASLMEAHGLEVPLLLQLQQVRGGKES